MEISEVKRSSRHNAAFLYAAGGSVVGSPGARGMIDGWLWHGVAILRDGPPLSVARTFGAGSVLRRVVIGCLKRLRCNGPRFVWRACARKSRCWL